MQAFFERSQVLSTAFVVQIVRACGAGEQHSRGTVTTSGLSRISLLALHGPPAIRTECARPPGRKRAHTSQELATSAIILTAVPVAFATNSSTLKHHVRNRFLPGCRQARASDGARSTRTRRRTLRCFSPSASSPDCPCRACHPGCRGKREWRLDHARAPEDRLA
jgi:hypothetical protein